MVPDRDPRGRREGSPTTRVRSLEMIKAEGPTPPPMRLEDRQWAGLFLFAGTVQFAIAMIIAEAVDPTYSVATNYISDLGVRAGAPIFNASIILLGIAILAASWFVFRAFKDRILMIVVLLAGAGAVGVGVFTENAPDGLHSIVSFITFLFAALSAILAFRVLRPPLSYLSVLLGVGSLLALGLYISKNYFDLGNGGMERMIVYPVLSMRIMASEGLNPANMTTGCGRFPAPAPPHRGARLPDGRRWHAPRASLPPVPDRQGSRSHRVHVHRDPELHGRFVPQHGHRRRPEPRDGRPAPRRIRPWPLRAPLRRLPRPGIESARTARDPHGPQPRGAVRVHPAGLGRGHGPDRDDPVPPRGGMGLAPARNPNESRGGPLVANLIGEIRTGRGRTSSVAVPRSGRRPI